MQANQYEVSIPVGLENGGAEVLPPTEDLSHLYPVDAPVQEFEVLAVNGKQRAVVTHLFEPLTLAHLKQYAADSATTVQILRGGKQRDIPNPEDADVNLFNALTQGARVRLLGDKPQERELTREQAVGLDGHKGFTAEEKRKAVQRALMCSVTVESGDGIDFLFEDEGEMTATLLVGDEESPAYTVPLKVERPEGSKRTNFRTDFIKVDRRREGTKTFLTTTTDFEAAARFFDKHFKTADRVAVERRPYAEADKPLFLAKFSPWLKSEVASAVVLSFGKEEGNF